MLGKATDENFEHRVAEICPNAAGKYKKNEPKRPTLQLPGLGSGRHPSPLDSRGRSGDFAVASGSFQIARPGIGHRVPREARFHEDSCALSGL